MFAKSEKHTCDVCCDEKTSVFKCPYCPFMSCTTCNEKVILESINLPCCMACKKDFPSDFFHKKFSDSFLNKKYKIHREKILFDKEKALLPATQPEVEKIQKIKNLEAQIVDIQLQEKLLKQKKKEIWAVWYQEQGWYFGTRCSLSKPEKKKDTFIGSCPSNDCRGFLTSDHKCGICGIKACSKCREVEKDEHKCDPNTVETIEELNKTTRSCPNCRTKIFRVEGCSQMYCTQCHVAFCWNTGQIEKGVIHNPHYYEYMRNNGGVPRNPHEEVCGGMPNAHFLQDPRVRWQKMNPNSYFGKNYVDKDLYLTEIYRMVNHLRQVVIRDLPTRIDNECNQDLRIDFLMKKFDEDDFKAKLQRREKDRAKKLEQREILETYCSVVQDLFTDFIKTFDFQVFEHSETKIREHTIKSYQDMNSKYKSKISCPVF